MDDPRGAAIKAGFLAFCVVFGVCIFVIGLIWLVAIAIYT